MIQIRNLTKSYGNQTILQNVDLDIEEGEAVVIIGSSGCGKSTLLRCINRLVVPESGQVLIDNQDIHAKGANVDQIRRNMGMVYQHFNLFSHLNVLENVIEAPMKVLKMSQEDAIKEAEKYLDMVGLIQWKYHMPNELSGGQKQRVAIARTLAMNPKYILFDEPTSALDPTMVGEVENVIQSLVDTGITSVIVTHEMRFAKSIASKVVFLAEQGIYESGTASEIFDNPQKPLTREFLYSQRTLSAEVVLGSDIESIITEFKAFLSHYEFESKQMDLFRVAFDEIVLPALKLGICSKIDMWLVCSDTSSRHRIYLYLPQECPDTTSLTGPDELNKKILDAKFREVKRTEKKGGVEIVLAM